MAKAVTNANDIPSESEWKKAMKRVQDETKRMKKLMKQEEMLLLPVQAAAMIGISPQAMERRIKDGSIRSFTIFNKVYVSGKQIDEMMNERIKSLIEAGADKNKIEEGIYKKMYLNAKSMKKKN